MRIRRSGSVPRCSARSSFAGRWLARRFVARYRKQAHGAGWELPAEQLDWYMRLHASRAFSSTPPRSATEPNTIRTQCSPLLAWTRARLSRINLVIAKPDGAFVHPDIFSQAFRRRVASAGVPRIRLHDLRHTHATLLLQAGISPKVVSERLGHATVAFTMQVYAHVIPGMQADAATAFSDLVFLDDNREEARDADEEDDD